MTIDDPRISQVEVIPFSIPFKVVPVNSGGEYRRCDHVLVRVHSNSGVCGVGEAAPMPTWIQGTQESITASLEQYLGPAVVGMELFNFAALHRRMDEVLSGDLFAKCALDMAVYDTAARTLGISVSMLLGGPLRESVPVVKSIRIDEFDATVERAIDLVESGFGMVKLKIGSDEDGDVERVRRVRRALGEKIRIRVDINGGYPSYDVALRVCQAIEDFDVALIEQPLPREDLDGMARLCRQLRTPVAADESLNTPHDALQLAERHAADIFNVKLQKAGGFLGALGVLSVAEASHKSVLIGAMKETSIGAAASAHLAACARGLRFESDMTTHTALVDDLVVSPLKVEKGHVMVPRGPGLGVEVDDQKVEKYCSSRLK